MEATCPSCGRARERCYCPAPGDEYTPSTRWHLIGIAGWLLTVLPTVHGTGSQAYFVGAVVGSLMVPVALRVIYVMVFARGPQLWGRALLSPWVWPIGIVLNLMAAGAHHPH